MSNILSLMLYAAPQDAWNANMGKLYAWMSRCKSGSTNLYIYALCSVTANRGHLGMNTTPLHAQSVSSYSLLNLLNGATQVLQQVKDSGDSSSE